ncbi:MAG: thioredoxin-like domain-containing protein [Chthoniobacterales bacterium]
MTLLASFLLQGVALAGLGKLAPLTVKDVSLMLRSGYTASAITSDLVARHFLGAIDADAEKQLTQAGANAELIGVLRSGCYAVPTEDVATLRKEMVARVDQRVAAQEESEKQTALYQKQMARSRVAATAPGAAASDFTKTLKGDLVTSKNGILNAYNDQALDGKKLIGLYFSAHWCGPCRKFTPELVEFYNRAVAKHPEFEIIFISNDRSAPAMEAYMRDLQMPWPAVRFDKIVEKAGLTRYAGSGIPCLVLVDAEGKVISDSYNGPTYRGPAKVLEDLDQIFNRASAPAVAQNR